MLNLAEALVDRGVEVDLFLTQPPGSLTHMVPAGVNVIVGQRNRVRSLPALVRYLRARRPAALLAAHQLDNVLSVLARGVARVPTKVIATVHNNRSTRPDASAMRMGILTQVMRLTYRRAYAIVAVSNGVADDVAGYLALSRSAVKVIYNPTINPRLLEAASEPIQLPWASTTDVPVVLGVGRLTTQKDFATLIRAFAIVREARPSRLLILGEGEDREMLERLVSDLGLDADVALPGTTPNPMAYMKQASVLALSSRWEGLGSVLIESLAVGTPVASTDCPSGPSEVLDGGRYGQIVPVGDAEALARAIVHTLDHPPPRDLLVSRGLWFSAECAAAEYLRLLGSA
jgi:glycosyltransferase involved in cell wall biosynthesis